VAQPNADAPRAGFMQRMVAVVESQPEKCPRFCRTLVIPDVANHQQDSVLMSVLLQESRLCVH
jgi:hypothetical protein